MGFYCVQVCCGIVFRCYLNIDFGLGLWDQCIGCCCNGCGVDVDYGDCWFCLELLWY